MHPDQLPFSVSRSLWTQNERESWLSSCTPVSNGTTAILIVSGLLPTSPFIKWTKFLAALVSDSIFGVPDRPRPPDSAIDPVLSRTRATSTSSTFQDAVELELTETSLIPM